MVYFLLQTKNEGRWQVRGWIVDVERVYRICEQEACESTPFTKEFHNGPFDFPSRHIKDRDKRLGSSVYVHTTTSKSADNPFLVLA